MKKLVLFFMMAAAVNAFALGKTKVKRVESSKVTDLDGYWNDTDVRIVCESLIEECITSPRVAKFEEQHGRPGLVIVGEIKNDSAPIPEIRPYAPLLTEHENITVRLKDIRRR